MKSIGVVIRGGMDMNKKVLTAVVLGIVSSGYFSRISEAVMLDTVYVEAEVLSTAVPIWEYWENRII